MGTGAFEGAFVSAERDLRVSVANDGSAFLQLIDSSPYAEYEQQGGGGIEDTKNELVLTLNDEADVGGTGVNPDADTRLDDVFRVRNTTGASVQLLILDGAESDEAVGDYAEGNPEEDSFQIYADTDGGGGLGQRIDTGSAVTLAPGDVASINIVVFLKENDPATLPEEILVIADGTS